MITTLTVPSEELFQALSPSAGGIRLAVWDFEDDPVGMDPREVDAAVLPYTGNPDLRAALPRAARLRLVHTQTTGYDGVSDLVGPGVGIATASGVHAAATAELAIGLALASLRGIDDAVRNQRDGLWRPRRYPGLADRRVLLVGVGGIGSEILRRLETFEVSVTRVGSSARDDDYGHVHASSELEELAPHHDLVILITPLTDATQGLVSAGVLAALPDGALVVNVARGAVVDTDALTKEVLSGRLKAAVDVIDPEPLPAGHPLWQAPGAIISPHVGGNTGAFWPRIVRLLEGQLRLLNSGAAPKNLVQGGPWG
jgi:phosphoglycerate dehydrogenase-like enzyme